MTSIETANSRIDHVFNIISKIFTEDQEYQASIKIFTSDDELVAIPCNDFMENAELKLTLSLAVQFLTVMLGNVSFITQETEAYTLSQEGLSEDEARENYKSVISQYGSIANSPDAKEVLLVMYDDGTNCLQRSACIVTNDLNKKTLDYGHIPEYCRMSVESKSMYDNIFGGMFHKAIKLRELLNRMVHEGEDKLQKIAQSNPLDIWLTVGASISSALETEAPINGVKMALQAYKSIKGTIPQFDFSEFGKTH